MIFTAIAVSLVCTLMILALQARVVTAMAGGANLSNHTTKKAVFISSAPIALPLIVLATLTITGFLDVPVSQWQMLTILIAYATGTVVFIKYTEATESPAKMLESKFSLLDRILVAIVIVLILDVVFLAALYPVSDNDALEY